MHTGGGGGGGGRMMHPCQEGRTLQEFVFSFDTYKHINSKKWLKLHFPVTPSAGLNLNFEPCSVELWRVTRMMGVDDLPQQDVYCARKALIRKNLEERRSDEGFEESQNGLARSPPSQ
jgi:hypothetical protein